MYVFNKLVYSDFGHHCIFLKESLKTYFIITVRNADSPNGKEWKMDKSVEPICMPASVCLSNKYLLSNSFVSSPDLFIVFIYVWSHPNPCLIATPHKGMT